MRGRYEVARRLELNYPPHSLRVGRLLRPENFALARRRRAEPEEREMKRSKQRILGGLAVAVASLGLAACGSSEETDPAASPPTTTAVTPTTAAADTSVSEPAATVDPGAQATQDLVAQGLATDALRAAVQSGDEGAIEAAVDAASRACPECPRPPYPHAIIAGGPGLVAVGAYDAPVTGPISGPRPTVRRGVASRGGSWPRRDRGRHDRRARARRCGERKGGQALPRSGLDLAGRPHLEPGTG